jgi:hypothetical protein
MAKHPKQVFVYQVDTMEDGTPLYAVVVNIEEIPEDNHGDRIGIYSLVNSPKFTVTRKLD